MHPVMATIAVFGASTSQPGDPSYEEGLRCGRLLTEAGFRVATGGYAGTMEAVSRGASEAGGEPIGYTAPSVFPARSGANAYVTEERPADTLVSRIERLTADTDGSIVLRGSIGTATELLVAWNMAAVDPLSGSPAKPVVAVGEPWSELVPLLERMLATRSGLVTVVDDVDQGIAAISELLRRR